MQLFPVVPNGDRRCTCNVHVAHILPLLDLLRTQKKPTMLTGCSRNVSYSPHQLTGAATHAGPSPSALFQPNSSLYTTSTSHVIPACFTLVHRSLTPRQNLGISLFFIHIKPTFFLFCQLCCLCTSSKIFLCRFYHFASLLHVKTKTIFCI